MSHPVSQQAGSGRVLLCRPRGGLNDTLCRIELCWRYADLFGRHLIIDTTHSALFGPFDDFFEVTDRSVEVSPRLTPSLMEMLNQMRCRPAALEGILHQYEVHHIGSTGMVEKTSGQPSWFGNLRKMDFESDYDEPLLVYDNCGGGLESLEFLKKIRMNEHLRNQIQTANASLASPYCAVHVRNTDYRSSYKKFFRKIKRSIGDRRVLVCSDDPAVIDYAQSIFLEKVIFFERNTRSKLRSGALHHRGSFDNADAKKQAAVDALIDLCALSNAQHLFICSVDKCVLYKDIDGEQRKVVDSTCAGTLSGFSQLARLLCLNKETLRTMMGKSRSPESVEETSEVTIVRFLPLSKRVRARLKRWSTHATGNRVV